MSIWMQALIVFAVMLLIMGYFQYRRSADVVAIIQEMFRPSYLVPAGIVAVIYIIFKAILSLLAKFF